MSEWVAYCEEESLGFVRRVTEGLDPAARLEVARGADELRYAVTSADPGELGVVVGPVREGVTSVNLAAAVADGGNARFVVLAVDEATGSLRSRAARAGVDQVVDRSELVEGPSSGDVPSGRAPAPEGGAEPGDDLAPVVALCSGRGGVGKTSLAAGLAATAARWGLRACLIDLDLSCGNAASCFGAARGGDLASLDGGAPTDAGLARLAVAVAPGVSLLGPCERPEEAELVAPLVGALLDWATREHDLVVVDTSTTFTDAVAQAIQRADRLLVVSDDRTGSVASVARTSGLAARLGVARTRIARLENRADPRARAEPDRARAGEGLGASRPYRVVEGDEVGDLLAAGRACELCEPGYPFADSVASALAQLLAELGRLPEHDEARRAYGTARRPRATGLFGFRREAR